MISSRAGKSECLYALSLPENLGEVDIITYICIYYGTQKIHTFFQRPAGARGLG